MSGFEITEPRSLDEAFAMLEGDDPAVRPIGGGTALMLMMKAQLFKPQRLVSLRYLRERFMGFEIDLDGHHFRIGAMTTFAALEHSPDICRAFPILPQTMKTLANVRVRNVASVGGNLAHGDPHLDMPPVWMALDAQALVVNPRGERLIPVADIFAGYYETTLAHDDLIAELRVPLQPKWRSTYTKVTTRSAHDWPALGLAVSVEMERDRVADLRIVLSAAVDRPTRMHQAEGVLRGQPFEQRLLEQACAAAVAQADIEADSRGTASYKKHLLHVHLRRTMQSLCRGDA